MSDDQNPRRAGSKRGHKGIAAAHRARKRVEAETRNARTPDERRRVSREGPVDKRGKRAG